MISHAKTINEYKLRKWTEETFFEGAVNFEMDEIHGDRAILTDNQGGIMGIRLDPQCRKVQIMDTLDLLKEHQ